jgi:hypothetical protein
MNSKVYIGDIGTRITLDCGTDISAATALQILVRKPDGSTVTWAAQASGTTALFFDTVAGSLDMPGNWRLQAKVSIGVGTWSGETVNLEVHSAWT